MFNFSEDTKAMLAWVPQFEADWGFYIFLTGLFGLTLSFVILMSKKCFQRTVETEGPKFGSSPFLPEVETKAPPLDRQPIYHAYEYLCAMKSYREGDEAERVAEDLRQAAYDREIRIWGAKKASQIEGESPHKAAISHEYWDEYGIEPILLFINPIEFPDQDLGHVRTYWDGMPEGSGQIYYYLQCDMNEIKERWSPSKVSLLDAALTAFEGTF